MAVAASGFLYRETPMVPTLLAERPCESLDAEDLGRLLASGGDARIAIDPATRCNRYLASPWPRGLISYASSTANDISRDAFAHVQAIAAAMRIDGAMTSPAYAAALARQRQILSAAYGLPDNTRIVFAASGTELEYVGLAAVPAGVRRICSILLGADEVGSGCVHAAQGHHFAEATPRGIATQIGEPLGTGKAHAISLSSLPVRDTCGRAFSSSEIGTTIEAVASEAIDNDEHVLLHVVHGSKTGLVLPDLAELDRLRALIGERVTIVVDACQARITSPAIAAYLDCGCVVMLTGSKFMGGPPFSAMALVPQVTVARAGPLPDGFARVFRRSEWPQDWPGASRLPDEANPGLFLRLEAALFELGRFQQLEMAVVERVVRAFHQAVRHGLIEPLGLRRLAPYASGDAPIAEALPVEMRTLSTLDLTTMDAAPDFDEAVAIYRRLAQRGVRLGQPVRCVRLADGRWGGTLRIGLSMPQVVEFSRLDSAALAARLSDDMGSIAAAIRAEVAQGSSRLESP